MSEPQRQLVIFHSIPLETSLVATYWDPNPMRFILIKKKRHITVDTFVKVKKNLNFIDITT